MPVVTEITYTTTDDYVCRKNAKKIRQTRIFSPTEVRMPFNAVPVYSSSDPTKTKVGSTYDG